MAKLYEKAFLKDSIVPITEAGLNIASSAVLYGLSVYTVFPIIVKDDNLFAFRLKDHYRRLINSAKIIGLDDISKDWPYEKFLETVSNLAKANDLKEEVFVRATIHVDELLPGTRSRGLSTSLSIFIYEATPIVPQDGMRLKTSVWRRTPDNSIPSRAKVNGAYVNSVLAKQDAIDSGYDDCIFLDVDGHVCELSAANIFLVKNNILITPDTASDLLEGINRRTVLELAKDEGLEYELRTIDLTELYTADEIFVCGTSSYLAPVKEIDARQIGDGNTGETTKKLKRLYLETLHGNLDSEKYMTGLS